MFTLPSKRKKPHPSYLRADTPPHRSQEAGVAGAAAAAAAAAADVAVAVVARFGAVRTPEVAVVALGRLGKGPVNVHADCGRPLPPTTTTTTQESAHTAVPVVSTRHPSRPLLTLRVIDDVLRCCRPQFQSRSTRSSMMVTTVATMILITRSQINHKVRCARADACTARSFVMSILCTC